MRLNQLERSYANFKLDARAEKFAAALAGGMSRDAAAKAAWLGASEAAWLSGHPTVKARIAELKSTSSSEDAVRPG